MIWLAASLTVMAVLLAAPVPRWLSRAQFRLRSPWTVMLLWQSIALAGGLSLIGAPLVYGLLPFGESVPQAAGEVLRLIAAADYSALEQRHVSPWHLFSLCLAVLLGLHLLLTLLRIWARTFTARRRHRDLVRLLSRSSESVESSGRTARPPGEALIIEHEAPLAYCLPGVTAARSMTVLSRGLIDALSEADLDAVVAHERTHLHQRHHLLTMAFDAWYRALPWLPTTRYGRQAVLELTEMLADDGALREHPRESLVRSLALSGGSEPAEVSEAGTDAADLSSAHSDDHLVTAARLRRLLSPPERLPPGLRALIVLLAAALLAVPTALLLVV